MFIFEKNDLNVYLCFFLSSLDDFQYQLSDTSLMKTTFRIAHSLIGPLECVSSLVKHE